MLITKKIKQRFIYSKAECLDCDIITSIQWKREHKRLDISVDCRTKQTEICPFCDGTNMRIVKINKEEYDEINRTLDLEDLQSSGEADEENDGCSFIFWDS